MEINAISGEIVDAAIAVHRELGPGLLESSYQACLLHELRSRGLAGQSEVPVPVRYRGVELEVGYRIDLLVEDCVLIELKSVARIEPIHKAQVISYLKLANLRLGMLMNFNVTKLVDGLQRIANDI